MGVLRHARGNRLRGTGPPTIDRARYWALNLAGPTTITALSLASKRVHLLTLLLVFHRLD